jgi:hypothetical protein
MTERISRGVAGARSAAAGVRARSDGTHTSSRLKVRKKFFFEKKNQKTFVPLRARQS